MQKSTGTTKMKHTKRLELKAKTLKLGTAMMAWESTDETVHLEQKTNKSPSALDYMRESDFYVYCTLVIKQADAVIASLAPFGVAALDLAEAKTAADNYLKAIPGPKNVIQGRGKALDELRAKVAETDQFLKEKLDKLMNVFIIDNPWLYFGYMTSRKIVDRGSRKKPDQ